MKNLLRTLMILLAFCGLLPLSVSAVNCLMEQGPTTFNEIYWNITPKWICPNGKIIISLGKDESHTHLERYVDLKVNGPQRSVELILVKNEPIKDPQIKFDHKDESVSQVTMTDVSAGTVHLYPMYTGDVTLNGEKRTLTIINNSLSAICFAGKDPKTYKPVPCL